MRVAYVCADPGVPVFGTKGSSVHVQALLRELVRRGHQVDLVCVRRGGPQPADLHQVRVHRVADDEGVARELNRLERVDLVYERYSLPGRAGTAVAAARGARSVLEVNAPLIDEQLRHRGPVDPAAGSVLRMAVGLATTVVCVSEPVADWVRARTGAQRLLVEPNGVAVERVRPADSAPSSPFTAGFVGSFRPWHGLALLLDAAAGLADVRLLLVGDGPDRAACERRAARPDLTGRVEFTGPVPSAEVPALLCRMHAGLAPAPPDSGGYFSPLKILEYLAAGIPVVASRSGPVERLVTDGHDGLLVPAGEPAALAAALARLRDDPELRSRLGGAGRRTALEHTWDGVLGRILASTLGSGATAAQA